MLKSPKTLALIAEQTTPTLVTRAQIRGLRTQGLPIVEQTMNQAMRYLQLHGAMVDDEDEPTVMALQEELRQSYKALQREADQLGDKFHRMYEIIEQLQRLHVRFRERAEAAGFVIP